MPLITLQSAKGFGFGSAGGETGADFQTIATTSITSATSTISFGSIPGTYSSLWIVGNIIGGTSCNITWTYNGSSTNYGYVYMENATFGSNNAYDKNLGGSFHTNSGTCLIKIPDYARTDKFKTAMGQYGTELYVSTIGAYWQSTAAVTSMVFSLTGTSFQAGSSLTLYGLK